MNPQQQIKRIENAPDHLKTELSGVNLRQGLFSKYDYQNKYLQVLTKKEKKIQQIQNKFGQDTWKIRFHELDQEGQLKYAQLKRDRVLTITGWSVVGSFTGFTLANAIMGTKRYIRARSASKQVSLVLTAFLIPIFGLTYHGFAKARQDFIKAKMNLIQTNSEKVMKEI